MTFLGQHERGRECAKNGEFDKYVVNGLSDILLPFTENPLNTDTPSSTANT